MLYIVAGVKQNCESLALFIQALARLAREFDQANPTRILLAYMS